MSGNEYFQAFTSTGIDGRRSLPFSLTPSLQHHIVRDRERIMPGRVKTLLLCGLVMAGCADARGGRHHGHRFFNDTQTHVIFSKVSIVRLNSQIELVGDLVKEVCEDSTAPLWKEGGSATAASVGAEAGATVSSRRDE